MNLNQLFESVLNEWIDPEFCGINSIPPAKRGAYQALLDDYNQGIVSSDELADELVSEFGMSSDDAEEVLYRIESDYEEVED